MMSTAGSVQNGHGYAVHGKTCHPPKSKAVIRTLSQEYRRKKYGGYETDEMCEGAYRILDGEHGLVFKPVQLFQSYVRHCIILPI